MSKRPQNKRSGLVAAYADHPFDKYTVSSERRVWLPLTRNRGIDW
jgi:hypothetical protein